MNYLTVLLSRCLQPTPRPKKAGPGARELYLRTRRDASKGKEATVFQRQSGRSKVFYRLNNLTTFFENWSKFENCFANWSVLFFRLWTKKTCFSNLETINQGHKQKFCHCGSEGWRKGKASTSAGTQGFGPRLTNISRLYWLIWLVLHYCSSGRLFIFCLFVVFVLLVGLLVLVFCGFVCKHHWAPTSLGSGLRWGRTRQSHRTSRDEQILFLHWLRIA